MSRFASVEGVDMNEKLRDAIHERIKQLSDEAGRQLLDYVEFLESKFNRSSRAPTTFERIAENVEGTLRGTRFGEAALKGGSEILEAAGSVIRGVAAAGRAVADEFQRPSQAEPKAADPETPPPPRTSAGAEVEVDVATSSPAAGESPEQPQREDGQRTPDPA